MTADDYITTLSISECACVAAGLRKRKADGEDLTDEEKEILRLAHERTGAWLRERGKLGGARE